MSSTAVQTVTTFRAAMRLFDDDSGVLHSPGGWKLESVASLHVDNEVIFIINVYFYCESRAQSI